MMRSRQPETGQTWRLHATDAPDSEGAGAPTGAASNSGAEAGAGPGASGSAGASSGLGRSGASTQPGARQERRQFLSMYSGLWTTGANGSGSAVGGCRPAGPAGLEPSSAQKRELRGGRHAAAATAWPPGNPCPLSHAKLTCWCTRRPSPSTGSSLQGRCRRRAGQELGRLQKREPLVW